MPLDEDELETDIGAGPSPAYGYDEDDLETDIGVGRRGRGSSDQEDDEETEIGSGRAYEDMTELDVIETGLIGYLCVKEGRRRGKFHRITDGTEITRNQRRDGDLHLDDPKVSNPHAKIRLVDEGYEIWDFGSRNGTFINGERIKAATLLNENDEVKIGDTVFVLKVLE
jgi:pSer/pThr/pTyr-binding forkhead associated (FHA) protein